MSDIDFDELDQAVSALMKDKDEPADSDQNSVAINSSSSSPQTAQTETPPLPDSQTSSVSDTAVVAPPASPTATPAAQPLSIKRRGRFMDVVHPKSDMTTQLPTKHQTTVVRPVVADNNQPAQAPVDLDLTLQADAPAESQRVENPNMPLYPDPIDLQDDKLVFTEDRLEQTEQQPVAVNPSSDEHVDDELAAIYESEPEEAPQNSPFLADAKVEKRPLGAPVESEVEALDTPMLEANLAGSEPEAQAQVAPVPVASLPAELQPDVAQLDTEVIEVAAPAEPLNEEMPVVKPETVVPAGGSIAQQYTEQPSSSDQANGSIYDTDSYHQPLQHPEKKKSSAIIIVWILVLALVGASGAAGYFYMTFR